MQNVFSRNVVAELGLEGCGTPASIDSETVSKWLLGLFKDTVAAAYSKTWELLGGESKAGPMPPREWLSEVIPSYPVNAAPSPRHSPEKELCLSAFKEMLPAEPLVFFEHYKCLYECYAKAHTTQIPPERDCNPRPQKRQRPSLFVPRATQPEIDAMNTFMRAVLSGECNERRAAATCVTVATTLQDNSKPRTAVQCWELVIRQCQTLLCDRPSAVMGRFLSCLRGRQWPELCRHPLQLAASLHGTTAQVDDSTAQVDEAACATLTSLEQQAGCWGNGEWQLQFCCKVAWHSQNVLPLPVESVTAFPSEAAGVTEGKDASEEIHRAVDMMASIIGEPWLRAAVDREMHDATAAQLLFEFCSAGGLTLRGSCADLTSQIYKKVKEHKNWESLSSPKALLLVVNKASELARLSEDCTDAQRLFVLADCHGEPLGSEVTVQFVLAQIGSLTDRERLSHMMLVVHLLSSKKWDIEDIFYHVNVDGPVLPKKYCQWKIFDSCKETQRPPMDDYIAASSALASGARSVGVGTMSRPHLPHYGSKAVSVESEGDQTPASPQPRHTHGTTAAPKGTAEEGEQEAKGSSESAKREHASKGNSDTRRLHLQVEQYVKDPALAWLHCTAAALWQSLQLSQTNWLRGELATEAFLAGVVNTAAANMILSLPNTCQCLLTADVSVDFPLTYGPGNTVKNLPLHLDRTLRLAGSERYCLWFHETKPSCSDDTAEEDRCKLAFMFMSQTRGFLATELSFHRGMRLHDFIALPAVLLTQQVDAKLTVWLGKCELGPNRELTMVMEKQWTRNVSDKFDACWAAADLRGLFQTIAEGMQRHSEYLRVLSEQAFNSGKSITTRRSTSKSGAGTDTHDSRLSGSGGAEGSADGKPSDGGPDPPSESHDSTPPPQPPPSGRAKGSADAKPSDGGAPPDPPSDSHFRTPPQLGFQNPHSRAAPITIIVPRHGARRPGVLPEHDTHASADLAALAAHGFECRCLLQLFSSGHYPKRVYKLSDSLCMKVVVGAGKKGGKKGGTVEAQVLRHLKQPQYAAARAVPLYREHALDNNCTALEMLLCNQFPSLDEFGLGRACDLVLQLVKAIHAWHEAGVFHRDIKPANLGSLGRRSVRILDAGSAWWRLAPEGCSSERHNRQLCARVGTHGYMAPELNGQHAFTTACDVYSLGVTLQELVDDHRHAPQLKHVLAIAREMQAPAPSDRPTLGNTIKELEAVRDQMPCFAGDC